MDRENDEAEKEEPAEPEEEEVESSIMLMAADGKSTDRTRPRMTLEGSLFISYSPPPNENEQGGAAWVRRETIGLTYSKH